ncbi:hypothetical protein [Chryseobacterium sp. SL1]|uniref:hypothetical protein n=1 Tax=Chryseobacterium sp. SL1 TaxID=2995159 RepID=UPI002273B23A|nr:hypothetical protein [Chryseobacterium sp. SL1]MCY1660769.1 hypothetical protein [Chryseobacterium sp. SL1]
MQSKILELIKHIKSRPKMFFWCNDNLDTYIIYFQGFFCNIYLEHNIDIERELSKWYQERVTFKAPNMVWFAQFKHINESLEQKEQIEKFLNTLIEFFKSYDLKNYSTT